MVRILKCLYLSYTIKSFHNLLSTCLLYVTFCDMSLTLWLNFEHYLWFSIHLHSKLSNWLNLIVSDVVKMDSQWLLSHILPLQSHVVIRIIILSMTSRIIHEIQSLPLCLSLWQPYDVDSLKWATWIWKIYLVRMLIRPNWSVEVDGQRKWTSLKSDYVLVSRKPGGFWSWPQRLKVMKLKVYFWTLYFGPFRQPKLSRTLAGFTHCHPDWLKRPVMVRPLSVP